MKTIFQSNLTEALGWTLLNSVWQGLLLWILVILALRLISNKLSKTRYALAVGSIIVFLLSNVVTFSFLNADRDKIAITENQTTITHFANQQISSARTDATIIQRILNEVSQVMPYVIMCWIFGSILFMLRIASGWWYINKLKTTATVLEEWSDRLTSIAKQLDIQRLIRVAESNNISAPMVIGFFKPMILFPTGLMSGLSTDQIESILIHELAHIRRHDYLVNLIQSIVESFYFFNPFVWMISNIIRREREYCCDDAVVTVRGNSLAYVKALSQLEEMRLSSPILSVGFAENKNQLLNRMKRIMEKSTKNYSSMDKIVPALLLVVGLVCASWLTINSDKHTKENHSLAQSDTTKKKSKSGSYSRSTIVTFDKEGKPHEEITEEYSGDEGFRPVIEPVEIAEIVDFPLPSVDMIDMEDFELPISPMPPLFFNIGVDTLPMPGMNFRTHGDVEEFSKAFQEKFRQQFSDFYKSNEKELQQMIQQLEQKFEENVNEKDQFAWRGLEISTAEQQQMQAEVEKMQEQVSRNMSQDMLQAKKQAERQMEIMREQQGESFKSMELAMADQRDHMKKLEVEMQATQEKLQAFEKEIKEELVKDGYVKKGEKIENIRWNGDAESMEVNGNEIKSEHREKYKTLHRKYFNAATGISE
jgi:beta-lactamase regulating signal transducer with metallopeptidase domain